MPNDEQLEIEETLHKYFHIPKEIQRLEVERMNFSSDYYNDHSFYSHTVYDGFDIHSEAARVDVVAIHLADAQQALNDHIRRKRRVYREFMDWVATLPADKQFHLEAKYFDYEVLSYWSIEDIAYKKIMELDRKSNYLIFKEVEREATKEM